MSWRMNELDMQPEVSDDVMWGAQEDSQKMEKNGVDMEVFSEENIALYENMPQTPQTVPGEQMNAGNIDSPVPQNWNIPSPEYETLKTVSALSWTHLNEGSAAPGHVPMFAEQYCASDNSCMPSSNFCDNPYGYGEFSADALYEPHNEFPAGNQPRGLYDVSHLAEPVVFEEFELPVPAPHQEHMVVKPVKVISPPARYNRRKVPEKKAAVVVPPAPRRGRGTKDGSMNSVQRHRANIKEFLESAPQRIKYLQTVDKVMDSKIRELQAMYLDLEAILRGVPRW